MSVQALSWVLDHSPAEGASRLVLISLANHASTDGHDAYPSVDTIRREARLKSRRTVQDALRKLERAGAIEARGLGPQGQGRWRLVMSSDGGAQNMRCASDDTQGAQSTAGGGAIHDSRVLLKPSLKPSIEPSPVEVVFAEWQEVFQKSKAHLSPARRKTIEKVLAEEPDLEIIRQALRGFKAHREKKPGGTELGDIFGTYAGTGDLRSRIEWMRSLSAGPSGEPISAEKRDRLREAIRYTRSLPHRPERERGVEAYQTLTQLGYEVVAIDEPPWAHVIWRGPQR